MDENDWHMAPIWRKPMATLKEKCSDRSHMGNGLKRVHYPIGLGDTVNEPRT